MAKHQIVTTSCGEVMVKQGADEQTLECYIGEDFDEYIGEIAGNVYDDSYCIVNDIENCLFQN